MALKIHFERTGGFAGITLQVECDTSTLPESEASKVENLVESAEFFRLPATIMSSKRGADRFQYELMIESGKQRHTVRTEDATIPETLQPLIDYLTEAAKRQTR